MKLTSHFFIGLAPQAWMTPTRSTLYGVALAFHAAFLLTGIIQDARSPVKFSDVDYKVFTDAAEHISNGGSPYERHTYRYSPLLAILLLPNVVLSPLWGKVLFSSLNIAAGLVIEATLNTRHHGDWHQVWPLTALWLWNPFSAQIATRGNGDSLVVLLILGLIFASANGRWISAALLYGLAVHIRIFPVIFGIPLILAWEPLALCSLSSTFPFVRLRKSTWVFGIVSVSTFFSLAGLFYWWYGWLFLYETYLYHFTRVDHRHNFSPFFYALYLTHQDGAPVLLSLTIFLCQWGCTLLLGCYAARRDISLALFLQTLVFVAFNKVCTSQYFVWWMGLLPLAADRCPQTSTFWQGFIYRVVVWLAAQALWLLFAYRLEFLGQATFLHIWIAGLFLLLTHIEIAAFILRSSTQQGKEKGS